MAQLVYTSKSSAKVCVLWVMRESCTRICALAEGKDIALSQGWINEPACRAQAQGPMSSGGPWAQGAPKPELLREVAAMYLLFVVEKGVFC